MKKQQTDTKPVLFLFDSDHPEATNTYGNKFDSCFLGILKAVDKKKATRSLVLRGDLLLHSLCYKPSKLSLKNYEKPETNNPIMLSNSITTSMDKSLFKLLISDLCDAFKDQWNTFNIVKLFELLMQGHVLTCIFLPSLPSVYNSRIDDLLGRCPYYMGAVIPDLSNPLQRELLVDFLICDSFIENGIVYMSLDIDGHCNSYFHGADKFSERGIVTLPMEKFAERSPLIPIPSTPSARAIATRILLQNHYPLNVHQRLASHLYSLGIDQNSPIELDWDLQQLPSAPDEVKICEHKLTDYLLNLSHERGQSKAKFFEQELAIMDYDWRFLHAQLIDALVKAKFEKVRVDNYGIRFNARLTIQGRNGRSATVNTSWIVRPKERASLITAFPGNKKTTSQTNTKDPLVLSPEVKGTHRWETIFILAKEAGELAATECVPTPMKISDGELIMDGECGGAYVVLPDARKGFARWLKTSGHGKYQYRSGVLFYADIASQSADRAKAYAEAFAKILRRNGIECKVVNYLT